MKTEPERENKQRSKTRTVKKSKRHVAQKQLALKLLVTRSYQVEAIAIRSKKRLVAIRKIFLYKIIVIQVLNITTRTCAVPRASKTVFLCLPLFSVCLVFLKLCISLSSS